MDLHYSERRSAKQCCIVKLAHYGNLVRVDLGSINVGIGEIEYCDWA